MTFLVSQKRFFSLCSLLLFILSSTTLQANTDIKIAVASNFHYSLTQLLKNYPKNKQIQFKLSSGSSGMLYAQIKQGAPFDLFLSADTLRPQLLEQDKLTLSRQTYALGKLALWSNKTNLYKHPSNKSGSSKASYTEVLQSNKGKLAYANPKLAPFGLAAEQTLDSLKLKQNNVILGNNVNQVFQFADSNNVDLGFIPLSLLIQAQLQLKQEKYNHYWLIPNQHYQTIEQQLVILKRSKHIHEVHRLVEYLLSPTVQSKLEKMGYTAVSTSLAGNNK
ncbi:molybdate ABC transporter substrate-binding protein [Psychrosphaera sp. F3M07]|uniref:molybdate ABC transporter substrate-binding protein n=1 Tax=Psychrosphaera sp. F3M07 TaxID=2841560 RepID=UPI001C0847A1|nr:molybdate ABC transporter substrate-binding protein [Psychrosphaera sp. F3M07]MBU2917021.1 molybdate ABC transporter substrate-binding protein [Psychrosphaera sp. F3M07]